MKPYIGMIDVSKSFKRTTAIKNMSFSINKGEVFGLLGPSGAGKTTIIKLLTQQLSPDSGAVFLLGDILSKDTNLPYSKLGIMSDNTGFYERLTVQENLEFFAGIRGINDKRRINELLEAVDLLAIKRKMAKELSRGMIQRLILSCSILHQPEILFLDEPTASLDPGTACRIHKVLQWLNQRGTTIFLTTHNIDEADRLCSRVAFITKGEVIACDTPETFKLVHAQNKIIMQSKNGAIYTVTKDNDGLRRLSKISSNTEILSIHSVEPTLQEVFLKITGRSIE